MFTSYFYQSDYVITTTICGNESYAASFDGKSVHRIQRQKGLYSSGSEKSKSLLRASLCTDSYAYPIPSPEFHENKPTFELSAPTQCIHPSQICCNVHLARDADTFIFFNAYIFSVKTFEQIIL